MASESDKSIVSRLKVNLSWKEWLKPFFIHPTVTRAAAENMELIRDERQKLQEAKNRQRAENEAKKKVSNLLMDIYTELPEHLEQRGMIESRLVSFRYSLQEKVAFAWKTVHRISDKKLQAELRALFTKLEMDKYTLYVEIASAVKKDENLLARLEELFANGDAEDVQMTRFVADVVADIPDEDVKASLLKRIEAYYQKADEENAPRIANSEEAQEQAREARMKARQQKAVDPYVNPWHILQGSFLKAVGFDGFESTSTELVDAQGGQYSYDQDYKDGNPKYNQKKPKFPTIPFSLALMTFLGFPARLHDGKANLGLREIIRNAFGGWYSLNNGKSEKWFWWLHWKNYTFEGKRLWNVILLPIKLVIFAFKLSTFLLKFALNVLKLVTEFLPEVIMNYSALFVGGASSGLLLLHYDQKNWPVKIFEGAFLALAFIISAPIHYAARLLVLMGTALTSPEKLARMAWNYGRALNSRWGYVFGFIGAAISVALTATLWAITFPLVFAKALALIPALAPIVTSIAQLPIIASTLAYINGAAILVAGTVPAAFSLAATAISAAFGVTVSAMTLAVATTVAIIVAPVASAASRLMDGLSNLWTQWKANSPLLFSVPAETIWRKVGDPVEKSSVKSVGEPVLQSALASLMSSCRPSRRTRGLIDESYVKLDEANTAGDSADKHAEAKQYQAQTPKEPAPRIHCEPPRSRRVAMV